MNRTFLSAPRTLLFDRIIIGYCALMVVLIAIFGRPLSEYLTELSFYAGATLLAVLIAKHVDPNTSFALRAVRFLYPLALFTFFYRMTGGLMFLFFDRFYDSQLIGFETSLFGIEPTLWIDSRLPMLLLTEILSFCYFMYYLMLPAFVIPVFLLDHRKVLIEFLSACCLTFFFSYLLFSLWPIQGPRWEFAEVYQHPVDGYLFRDLVKYVIDTAAVRGGAMPSSHTGVALVVLVYCWRHYRFWGWIMIPITTGLAVGTFWGRFHYVSDTIVGALLAILSIVIVDRLTRKSELADSMSDISLGHKVPRAT